MVGGHPPRTLLLNCWKPCSDSQLARPLVPRCPPHKTRVDCQSVKVSPLHALIYLLCRDLLPPRNSSHHAFPHNMFLRSHAHHTSFSDHYPTTALERGLRKVSVEEQMQDALNDMEDVQTEDAEVELDDLGIGDVQGELVGARDLDEGIPPFPLSNCLSQSSPLGTNHSQKSVRLLPF